MYRLKQVLDSTRLRYSILGESDNSFSEITEVRDAHFESLIWISSHNNHAAKVLASTPARVVVLSEDIPIQNFKSGISLVLTKDPRLMFCRIMSIIVDKPITFQKLNHSQKNLSPAKIMSGVSVAEKSSLGKCTVKDNTVIYPNVTIYDDVTIGENCVIHAGSVLGVDGFGIAKAENGKYEKIMHIGSLEIGNNVEIFSNVSIARGTLTTTKIQDGCKINNNCHVAHNVSIGKNTVIAAGAVICGSVHVGNNCWIGPGAILRNGISVGNNATIGMGSVVTKSVPENEMWLGNPAQAVTSLNTTGSD